MTLEIKTPKYFIGYFDNSICDGLKNSGKVLTEKLVMQKINL